MFAVQQHLKPNYNKYLLSHAVRMDEQRGIVQSWGRNFHPAYGLAMSELWGSAGLAEASDSTGFQI